MLCIIPMGTQLPIGSQYVLREGKKNIFLVNLYRNHSSEQSRSAMLSLTWTKPTPGVHPCFHLSAIFNPLQSVACNKCLLTERLATAKYAERNQAHAYSQIKVINLGRSKLHLPVPYLCFT